MSEQTQMSGKCLCGSVSYTLTGPAQLTAICHCKNCQRQSGTAFSVIVGVLISDLSLNGATKVYHDKGETGRPVERHFCPDCGSPLLSKIEPLPDMVFLKAGTLDDTSSLDATVEVFCESAMPLKIEISGTEKFARSNI